MLRYMREHPRILLALAVGLPLAIALLNIFIIYSPAFPGSPPRDSLRILVLAPPFLAVALLQVLPFRSVGSRLLITAAFGLLMLATLFAIHLFGACSYGDCF